MGWDLEVLRQLAGHRTGWADASTRVLMTVGMSPLAYGAALVLCLAFGWRCRAWAVAIAGLVSGVLCLALATVGKHLVGRPRPPAALALVHPGGYSMPSSVAAMTLGAAVPLIVFGLRSGTRTGRLLAALLAVAVGAIGLSMVYLGAHWASDVVAGWGLGALGGLATLAVVTRVTGRLRALR